MPRYAATLLALATLSATALLAQSSDSAGPASTYTQSPAPIQRDYVHGSRRDLSGITTQQPAQGIYVRIGAGGSVSTISKTADHTEFRIDRGIVNISVHHPADGSLILVDLPGGQTDLLKDGFYTFNAQTNTVRVLVGEARTFPSSTSAKGLKVKENQQFAFNGGGTRSTVDAMQAHSDVLPFPRSTGGEYGDDRPRYDGPHGDGFYSAYSDDGYGYPYPYGWGYPYGYYGYPFVGVGFGYGFYGGYGFHGGYYGGGRR